MSDKTKLLALAEVVLPFKPLAPATGLVGRVGVLTTARSRGIDDFVQQAEAFLQEKSPGTHPETLARRARVAEAARLAGEDTA